MLTLGDRLIDDNGNVVYFTNALIEMLYDGYVPNEILYPLNDPDVKAFNQNAYENFDDVAYVLPKKILNHKERQQNWFYPEKYDLINLDEFFMNLCTTVEEKDRVNLELKLFREKGFEKFLRCCIWLSDIIKENDWVVGVGRGSSCASFCLYKLQIHLVNPLEYNLDIKEFLKD